MKITIIFPKREKFDKDRVEFWDLAFGHSILATNLAGTLTHRASSAPLVLAILSSLIPEEFDIELIDEYVNEADLNHETDLVIITFFTTEATRGYVIADHFRKRGIPVIIGGYHASILPEEAAGHADAVAVGEAETLMPVIISDFKTGTLKNRYVMQDSERPDLSELRFPRWDRLDFRNYFNPTIQTTRGCPMRCEFCSVSVHWGSTYRHRPLDHVIKEIQLLKPKLNENARLMIVDDDISAHRDRSKELFGLLTPLNIRWMGQGSMAMAGDDEFLELMSESGGTRMIIGFETISERTLKEMKKNPSNKIAEYSSNAKKIQSYGVAIISTFVLGNDNDDGDVFDSTADFIIENDFGLPQLFCVTPFPGTALARRLEQEGRILSKDWKTYTGTTVQFRPKQMTPEELQNGYYYVCQKIFSFKNICKRLFNMWESWDQNAPYDKRILVREKIDTLLLNQSFNHVAYKFPSCFKPDQQEEVHYKTLLNKRLRTLLAERNQLLSQ